MSALVGDADVVGPWRQEVLDLVRAASGGLLFGVPLMYTMEVWWTGTHSDPSQSLLVLALLVAPGYALNKTAGFRSSPDVRIRDAVADTIEAVAISVVVTAVCLALLREISPTTPAQVMAGKVVYESVPFCLGVGVARHFLDGDRVADDEAGSTSRDSDRSPLADLAATTVGAVFVSLSIAPTDEVPMIASAMDPAGLLLMVAASLVVSYGIVFAAGFTGQQARHEQEGAAQRPLVETVLAYLVALLVAATLLWLFQRDAHLDHDLLSRVIVLGLPAAIGGAAGRLAV